MSFSPPVFLWSDRRLAISLSLFSSSLPTALTGSLSVLTTVLNVGGISTGFGEEETRAPPDSAEGSAACDRSPCRLSAGDAATPSTWNPTTWRIGGPRVEDALVPEGLPSRDIERLALSGGRPEVGGGG